MPETIPDAWPTIIIILLAATLMLLTLRRLRAGTSYLLRPLKSYAVLREQIGQAVESGRRLHVTLGRAPLPGVNGPTSAAALEILTYLAKESSQSGLSPQVTVGEATLLPAAQGEISRAQIASNVEVPHELEDVQFVADDDWPLAYAAGVADTVHRGEIANNVAVGRFGSEIAIIAEAARRGAHNQIIGTDDPTAMALATLYSDNVLWGEEIFTAGAYLEGKRDQIAGVRTQDILRWLVAGGILLTALLRIGGLL